VKNPCSKYKLARKGALIDVAANVNTSSLRVLSWVLGISCHNLSCTIKQRRLVQNSNLSPFVLLERRKRQDGVTAKTKMLMIAWWTIETKVSPNKKDVTCKRLKPNQYEAHATHYLLESQISFNHWIIDWIWHFVNHKDHVHYPWLLLCID
jgi:hypothetical protein